MAALIRMSLALQSEIVAEIDEIAAEQRCSRTELIRRAMAMYRWFHKQLAAGNSIAVISPDGTVTPKEFVIAI